MINDKLRSWLRFSYAPCWARSVIEQKLFLTLYLPDIV